MRSARRAFGTSEKLKNGPSTNSLNPSTFQPFPPSTFPSFNSSPFQPFCVYGDCPGAVPLIHSINTYRMYSTFGLICVVPH